MAKAMLIMDMPSSCDVCDFVDERYHYCDVPWFGKDVSDYVECRHEDCPLREVPQKETSLLRNDEYDDGFVQGYNSCIDEILGVQRMSEFTILCSANCKHKVDCGYYGICKHKRMNEKYRYYGGITRMYKAGCEHQEKRAGRE